MNVFHPARGVPGLPIDGDIARRNDIEGPPCPQCGRSFGATLRYPFFVPGRQGSPELKRAYRIVARKKNFWRAYDADPDEFWRAYARFRQLIAKEAPNAWFVPAGTEWGLISLSVDEPVDVAGPYPGVLVCRKSVAEQLLSEGHRLEVYPTIIRSGHKRIREPYVELFAPPRAHKAKTIPGDLCEKCLRFERGLTVAPLAVDEASVPVEQDLFRVLEQPSILFAKDTLVAALSRYHAPNVRWETAELV